MKRFLPALITVVVVSGCMWAHGVFESHRLFAVTRGLETTLDRALPDLMRKRLILVGEHHNVKRHHNAQLLIIRALQRSGVPVAVGLEMFRSDSQDALDLWVSGKMSKREFQKIYYENWGLPWPLYSMIFDYARKMRIPLVGLNVSSALTRQVAREGFKSLSKEQKAQLPPVACDVDQDYMTFIKKAYGAHAHGKLNFTYSIIALTPKLSCYQGYGCLSLTPKKPMLVC